MKVFDSLFFEAQGEAQNTAAHENDSNCRRKLFAVFGLNAEFRSSNGNAVVLALRNWNDKR